MAVRGATNASPHARVLELINAPQRLVITAEVEQLAVTLQAVLRNGGLVRAAGVNDLVIAATTIVHGAVVLHDDVDYEHIATVSELHRTWGGAPRLRLLTAISRPPLLWMPRAQHQSCLTRLQQLCC